VRTPGFDPAFILVQGIQVSHVGDAATARAAVEAVRYPPLGERGIAAGSRAAEFARIPLVEHMEQSSREILLACMIEDMAAVERIDEITSVAGVDLLAVGPSDLSRSLSVSGQPDHPRLVAAIDRVREAGQEKFRRAARVTVEARRLSAQCRPAQGAGHRLHQLRTDARGTPAALVQRPGRSAAWAPWLTPKP
jgi:2-keto-3-deoxy-L-rhamnonate aldolase RhmA